MKMVIILIFTFVVVSCHENFDELNNTDQRRITFDVCTDGFFDNFLSMSNGEYSKGIAHTLDGNHKIRVSGYCYDMDGNVVQNTQELMNGVWTKSITFFHLQKDHQYRFEFFADVVENNMAVDFYESWFQLGIENIERFYLFCFQPNNLHLNNIVRHSTLYAKPENNTLVVSLEPITVNGYCVLSNLQNIERVNGYYGYNESFFINSMSGRKRSTHEYSYMVGDNKNIVIPITTGTISDTVSVKIKRVMLNKVDSADIYIRNPENRPFVTDIDCQTLKIKSCVYY